MKNTKMPVPMKMETKKGTIMMTPKPKGLIIMTRKPSVERAPGKRNGSFA